MNKPKYAVIQDYTDMRNVIDLKAGKKYKITESLNIFDSGWGFYTDNELGTNIYCLENYCAHLNGAGWKLIYE